MGLGREPAAASAVAHCLLGLSQKYTRTHGFIFCVVFSAQSAPLPPCPVTDWHTGACRTPRPGALCFYLRQRLTSVWRISSRQSMCRACGRMASYVNGRLGGFPYQCVREGNEVKLRVWIDGLIWAGGRLSGLHPQTPQWGWSPRRDLWRQLHRHQRKVQRASRSLRQRHSWSQPTPFTQPHWGRGRSPQRALCGQLHR
jgi:hypothetical protein